MNLEPSYDWTVLSDSDVGLSVTRDDDRDAVNLAEQLYPPFDDPGYPARRQAPQALSVDVPAGISERGIRKHETGGNRSVSERGAASESPAATAEEASEPWPDPLDPEAFHGLAGEIVNQIGPYSSPGSAAVRRADGCLGR